jgi:hypothetical protein
MSKREFNTPQRANWNAPIHQMLKAIDEHNKCYLLDGNNWHLEKAQFLRTYLHELKTWIHLQEALSNEASEIE